MAGTPAAVGVVGDGRTAFRVQTFVPRGYFQVLSLVRIPSAHYLYAILLQGQCEGWAAEGWAALAGRIWAKITMKKGPAINKRFAKKYK